MSLVTVCPACHTAFKVGPEQLAARRGEVCCGKCSTVFNALDHLAETPESISATDIPTENVAEKLPEFAGFSEDSNKEPELESIEPDIAPDTEPGFPEEPLHDEPHTSESAPVIEALPDVETLAAVEPLPKPSEPTLIETYSTPAPTNPEPVVEAIPDLKEPQIELPDFKPKSHRWAFLISSLVFVLLLLLGAGQSLYFLRTQLAAQYPPLRPLLLQLCGLVRCTVELPKQVDLLAIDESDLQQDNEHENVVILSAALINHAHYTQAYPALEVTLTDANDRPVLRRIFTPSEYLPSNIAFKTGMPADGDIRIQLHLSTGDIKATGYRVYIAYL